MIQYDPKIKLFQAIWGQRQTYVYCLVFGVPVHKHLGQSEKTNHRLLSFHILFISCFFLSQHMKAVTMLPKTNHGSLACLQSLCCPHCFIHWLDIKDHDMLRCINEGRFALSPQNAAD